MKLKILLFLVLFIGLIPSLSFSVPLNITPSKTAMISSGQSTISELDGNIGVSCTSYNSRRSYIQYDLSELDVSIEKATLWLFKEDKNNPAVLDIGFYYIENDNWGTNISWYSQPCEVKWDLNSECNIYPFRVHQPNREINIWDRFDLTELVIDEEDGIFSFVMKVMGSDTTCKIDQWVYYGNNSFLEIEGCIPEWVLHEDECQLDDTKFIYYTDNGNCTSIYNLPEDNGTYVTCDYCTSDWVEINTSCQSDDTKIGYYIDQNDCYSKTNLESDLNEIPGNKTYFCDYCISEWVLNESWGKCQSGGIQYKNYYDVNDCLGTELPPDPENKDCNYTVNLEMDLTKDEVYVLDEQDAMGISLELMVDEDLPNSTISMTSYSDDPVNSTFALLGIGNYVEILTDSSIPGNLSWALIKIYYTDEDILTSGVVEEDLKLYTFNEDLSKWEEVEESGVNTSFNHVWGNVTHFSFYGAFEYREYCGDDICNSNENYYSCPEDCHASTTTITISGGGGSSGDTSDITTTTVSAQTTTTVIQLTSTTTFPTTSTTVISTTTTLNEGLGPTGEVVKITGDSSIPRKLNTSILVTMVILIIGVILLKFDSLKRKFLKSKISFLKNRH
ncbi:MAG: hypothetical protein GF368_03900 [Candidatus Aenigmarchaeota archaeon]|nr:hypothetical protein [Candidatus Aenigmarchaeota archaeon]